jgi:hypothetical protein
VSYGGTPEAERLHRVGYPTPNEQHEARMMHEHEQGKHVDQRDPTCQVCRYVRKAGAR